MKFGRLGVNGSLVPVTDDEADALERQVRETRVEKARANKEWTEIAPSTRLVRRGPGGRIVVDSETDIVYRDFRGAVFAPGRAAIEFVDERRKLAYIVDRREIRFYEATGEIWSEIFERRARRAARTRAPL
jgi:hypothetical protein